MTIGQRKKKLEEMARGNGLSDAYTTTLTRLKGQKGSKSVLGLKVLMWVLYSERPLRAEELCHALGVEIGSEDLDSNNLPAIRTLLASCLGLVTVEVSSSTVRLVHFTLQEHLLSDPALFHSPHAIIAEVCLTYLNFRCIRDLSPTVDSAPSTMPLLKYASLYWGNHIRIGMTENVKILAQKLLDRFDEHISSQLLLLHYNKNRRYHPQSQLERGPMGFTGLHAVSFLGVAEIVADVLEMKEWDVNASDCIGHTALTWAASRGHEMIVKILLERGDINPDKADTYHGRTPLWLAAEKGHEGVVKILLERGDVNPDQLETEYGRTPLSPAAQNGHEGVVKILLERGDVNPNQPDTEYGETPLLLAAQKGHEGVVKILLERGDVNPDQPDTEFSRTPLSWAAMYGHEGIVKILLERGDVNPNQPDTYYSRTPLLWAARNGHEGVVGMLLERGGVNPDQLDTEYGRTPLAWAAKNGRSGVVKILLERQDVCPTALDHQNQTPLSLALSKGRDEVVRILRDNINSRRADRGG